MKHTIVLATILTLLGIQTFSQNSSIKGKCIDNNSGIKMFWVSANFYTNSGERFGIAADEDGSFEFEIGNEAGDIMVIIPNCYTIKILNIPTGFKQIDLEEIRMVDSFHKHLFRMDGNLAYMYKETVDEHNSLRKEVLEKYRIRVLKKELKPTFSDDNIIFDYNKGSSCSDLGSIKGRCVDYENGGTIPGVSIGFHTPAGEEYLTCADNNGNFDFKIGDEAGDIIVTSIDGYTIKILNIPSGFKQIDLGEIMLAKSYYPELFNMDGSLTYVPKEVIDNHNCIRKEILEKYRIRVLEKELKPRFSGYHLIFDFGKKETKPNR